MHTWTVYALIDPRDGSIHYIGATRQALKTRVIEHVSEATSEAQAHLQKSMWIRKILSEGVYPEFLPLEEGLDAQSWEAAERKWVAHYREICGEDLCNMTGGGNGTFLVKPRPEVVEKTRSALKGRKMPPGFSEFISQVNRGRKRSEETRARMSAAQTGRFISETHRARMSAARKGKPWTEAQKAAYVCRTPSDETREKMSAARKGRPWSEARRAAHAQKQAKSKAGE